MGSKGLTLALLLSLTACLSWRVTLVSGPAPRDGPLDTIALAPAHERFTDLIGFALAEGGYTIIDTGMTLALLVLLQVRQEKILTPQVMAAFQQRGIDAVLTVNRVEHADHLPEQATAHLYSTRHGQMLCQVEWHAGWRHAGSVEATREIASMIVKCLERPSDSAEALHLTTALRR